MGRWAPHLEQPGAVKRWQLGSTKYLSLGQKSITASLMVALGPKGRPWWGRRCKGHSPLRGEAPGLDGQHGRAPHQHPPPRICRDEHEVGVLLLRDQDQGFPWLCRSRRIQPLPPQGVLPICERGASKTCASQPVSSRALWDSAPTRASPLPPRSRHCGEWKPDPLFHFPGGYQLPECPVHLLSWNPSTHHLALFEIPSHQAFQFGGQVWGLGKEGLGVLARAQQPQPLELHEGQPAAPSPRAVQVRA